MKHPFIFALAVTISGCVSTPPNDLTSETEKAPTPCKLALADDIAAIKALRIDLANMELLAKSDPTPENNENLLAAQAALSANEAAFHVTAVHAGCPTQLPDQ